MGGGSLGVNYNTPNIEPRISIDSGKGEILARLGQRPVGLELGQFIAPHGLAVDSRGCREVMMLTREVLVIVPASVDALSRIAAVD